MQETGMTKLIPWLIAGLVLPLAAAGKIDPVKDLLPDRFDSLGPTVHQLVMENGRKVHYIDDGEPGWLPVVFTGGLGTSVRIVRLLDFLRTMRQVLRIRFITVERNGFGQTDFDPDLAMADFVREVEAVLDHLDVEKFAVFGISGGGPYTAKIASMNADRLLSVHMAATSPMLGGGDRCSDESPASSYRSILQYPMQYFGFPESSPVHQLEGFQDSAFDEASRAHFVRGQKADLAPLDHEISLYCDEGWIDNTGVTAPVYVYHGMEDPVMEGTDPETWREAFPESRVMIRTYAGEGHDVQYRHLDQILLDMAGYGDRVLVCRDGSEELVRADAAAGLPAGLCLWSGSH